MTDPTTLPPSSPVALLDQLDELRAKATPGPWAQQNGAPNLIYGDPGVGLFVCNTGYDRAAPENSLPAADAALIVAAVNAVGPLTDAVRNVLLFAETIDGHDERATATASLIRRAVSDGMAPVTP